MLKEWSSRTNREEEKRSQRLRALLFQVRRALPYSLRQSGQSNSELIVLTSFASWVALGPLGYNLFLFYNLYIFTYLRRHGNCGGLSKNRTILMYLNT